MQAENMKEKTTEWCEVRVAARGSGTNIEEGNGELTKNRENPGSSRTSFS